MARVAAQGSDFNNSSVFLNAFVGAYHLGMVSARFKKRTMSKLTKTQKHFKIYKHFDNK